MIRSTLVIGKVVKRASTRGAVLSLVLALLATALSLVAPATAAAAEPQPTDAADAAVLHGGGRLSTFDVSRNGHLWETSFLDGRIEVDRGIKGGGLVGTASAVFEDGGPVRAFVRAKDGKLWHLSVAADGTSKWRNHGAKGGGFTGEPAAVVSGGGKVHVVVPAKSGDLWLLTGKSGGKWKWKKLGSQGDGFRAQSPSLMTSAKGAVWGFIPSRDGKLWRFKAAGKAAWKNVGKKGRNFAGSAATSVADGASATVVVSDGGGSLWAGKKGLGKNLAWKKLGSREGGFADAGPTAVVDGSGQLQVFATATQGAIWKLERQPGGAWTFEKMGSRGGGFDTERLSATTSAGGLVRAFAPSGDGFLWLLLEQAGGGFLFDQLTNNGGGFGAGNAGNAGPGNPGQGNPGQVPVVIPGGPAIPALNGPPVAINTANIAGVWTRTDIEPITGVLAEEAFAFFATGQYQATLLGPVGAVIPTLATGHSGTWFIQPTPGIGQVIVMEISPLPPPQAGDPGFGFTQQTEIVAALTATQMVLVAYSPGFGQIAPVARIYTREA